MRLQDLLYKVNILKIVGNINIDIDDVQFDSRKIKQRGLFVALLLLCVWVKIYLCVIPRRRLNSVFCQPQYGPLAHCKHL